MKRSLTIAAALFPQSVSAQSAEGHWDCVMEISGDPAVPGASTVRYDFDLGILPDGTANGTGTVEDVAGKQPIAIAANWTLKGRTFEARGTLTGGAGGPFAFDSEFVSGYDMASDKVFGSGVRYTTACEKRG